MHPEREDAYRDANRHGRCECECQDGPQQMTTNVVLLVALGMLVVVITFVGGMCQREVGDPDAEGEAFEELVKTYRNEE
jgi:hypothetical protein